MSIFLWFIIISFKILQGFAFFIYPGKLQETGLGSNMHLGNPHQNMQGAMNSIPGVPTNLDLQNYQQIAQHLSSQSMGMADNKQPKNKRRSKNDQEGRTHKCSLCEKTYLSYPALYTHLKTKHADAKGVDGQPLTPLQGGRGRGRPKKNIDPLTEEYFKARNRLGGPTHVLNGFDEVYNLIYSEGGPRVTQNDSKEKTRDYGNYQGHPMWPKLKRLYQDAARSRDTMVNNGELVPRVGVPHPPSSQEPSESNPQVSSMGGLLPAPTNNDKSETVSKNDEEKKQEVPLQLITNCDDLFCTYLNHLCLKVNPEYYKQLLKFVLLYRECLNDFGWQKKYESMARLRVEEAKMKAQNNEAEPPLDEAKLFQEQMAKAMSAEPMVGEFCIHNNGEYAPEVCNEFVTLYWEQHKHIDLTRDDAIDLTRNLCHWLFVNGFTCSKLTIINPSSQGGTTTTQPQGLAGFQGDIQQEVNDGGSSQIQRE